MVLRLAVRDWRAGELRLLLAAVVVAVGTVTAIGLFVDRLREALLSESTTFLGADRVIGSTRPIPEDFRDAARRLGLAQTDVITFPSMLFADESTDARSQLVSVKAVGDGYPLRGVLRVAEEPFGPAGVTDAVPAPGEVWLDSRLFPALDLAVGDTVALGYARLQIARVLAGEPDRGGSVFDLGPRLLMHIDDVPETRVIQPGSRVGYRLLLAGDDGSLAELRAAIEPDLAPNYRWRGIADANPTIGEALDRAESFLLLGGLLAVLLAGVAVALGAHRYARRHYDHVGVLKTLGATPSDVQWGYLGILSVVGGAGVVTGPRARGPGAPGYRGGVGGLSAGIAAVAQSAPAGAGRRHGVRVPAGVRLAAAARPARGLADARDPAGRACRRGVAGVHVRVRRDRRARPAGVVQRRRLPDAVGARRRGGGLRGVRSAGRSRSCAADASWGCRPAAPGGSPWRACSGATGRTSPRSRSSGSRSCSCSSCC